MVRVHLPEPNALDVRDLWDSITSAVGGAFNDDKTTTTSDKATKTTAKTVVTTETPKKTTDEPTTKTTAQTADKTTSTAKKTTATATTTSEDKTTSTKAAAKTTATSTAASTSATSTADKAAGETTKKAATTSTSIAAPKVTPSETVLTLDVGTPTLSTGHPKTTSSTATATSTTAAPTSSSAAAASKGSSPAAKAGIAIGVLAGIFFVSLAVYLLFRRRKTQQQRRRLDDEKNGPFADSAAIPGSKPAGSRLSLQAATQLFTAGTATAVSVAGAAGASVGAAGAARGGNAIALQNQAPMGNRGPYGQMNRVPGGAAAWGERPTTSQSQNQNNPFGDGAQRLSPSANSNFNSNANTRDANSVSPASPRNAAAPFPKSGAAAAGAAAAGVYTGSSLTRKASTRKDGPQALDLTLAAPRGINGNGGLGPVPPSPAGTEYSMNSMPSVQSTSPIAVGNGSAAIAAAGGPAVSAVHRVQLDFNPTLDDELGLRAGQLVRLLHEYDDGWALCIRLDRSQQGVVPRTCLSTRPVKPRPPPNGSGRPGPPINTNPHGRPMTPQGGPGGPPRMMNGTMNSNMNRNMNRNMNMNTNMNMPRTQSPSPMDSQRPAPISTSSSKAPSLPPMSFSELPAFDATPSDASRSPSPSNSNRTTSPTSSTANAASGSSGFSGPSGPSGPSGGPQSPVEMPAAAMPAVGVATSVPAPAARMRPGNSIGRKPVPGQAL